MVAWTLAELAIHLGGTLVGGNADGVITGVAGLDEVGPEQLAFIASDRYLAAGEASAAAALLAPLGTVSAVKPLVLVPDPRAAFARALSLFDWRRPPIPGIDPSATIAQSAGIHAYAHIGARVVVGERAIIGKDAVIHPHAVIGDHVEIGPGTVIYPHVVIYPYCTIGSRCIIHAGTVVGSDGFGFQPTPEGWVKIPHVGTVRIGDDVEIGANCTIDRATTGETVIDSGTKIDNLTQIAHNVKVGKHCVLAAGTGVAGSSVLEDWVALGGQVGIGDHVHLGSGVRVAGQAGVTRDVAAGLTVSGNPVRPIREHQRIEVALERLPGLLATIRRLEKRVAELEKGE